MITKAILDDEETFTLILQLADIATAAHERGDYERRDEALEEIRMLRENIAKIERNETKPPENSGAEPGE
jgi:uncharacterized protein HemY